MRRNWFIVLLMAGLWLIPSKFLLHGQYFDYHREEGPSLSWNTIPLYDARMLGAGCISFMASPSFAAAVNPALIPRDRKFFSGISYRENSYEAFQYWGVNQGAVVQEEPLEDRDDRLSGFSIAIPFKGIRFSAGWHIGTQLKLPYFMYISDSGNYHGTFEGVENHAYAAVALGLGKKLDIGVKIDYMWGERSHIISEGWFDSGIRFDDTQEHKSSCWTPTLGITYKATPNWMLGAFMEFPFEGTVDRSVNRSVKGPNVNEVIADITASDSLYRPKRFSAGSSYNVFPGLIVAAEATYVLWSDYKYEFFGEVIPRDMKDTLLLAVGAEYGEMGRRIGYNIRAGYRMDPQPVKKPGITFHQLTGGLTLRVGHAFFDVGAIVGFGKTGDIDYNFWAFTGSFRFFLGEGGAPTVGTK